MIATSDVSRLDLNFFNRKNYGAAGESSNHNQSAFAKATADTHFPQLRFRVACHPKPAGQRVVGAAGIEPATPTIFTAWAHHLLQRAQLEEGDHVLDVACGTGVVSRFAKEAVGERGRVVGVDLNPGMLEVAASTASSKNLEIEWMQSDAAAIPLSEPNFDVAFCQQGLQFFPDKLGALKEMRRLLKPNGRCIICVAREKELCTNVQAQYDAVAKHLGPDAAAAFAAVSSLSSRDQLQQLFDDAGFANVDINSVKLMVENENGVEFVRGTILASPIGSTIVEWDEAAREKLVADILKGYGECFDGQRLRFPHVSHVVVASNA